MANMTIAMTNASRMMFGIKLNEGVLSGGKLRGKIQNKTWLLWGRRTIAQRYIRIGTVYESFLFAIDFF